MRKLLLIVLIALGVSCTPNPFTGRIVEKEYVAGHRCHTEGYKVKDQAGVIVPHTVVTPKHYHKWENAKVTLWVANRYEVR
ncbi:MAG: hypothetical protein EOO20_13335, partial [Chryseobacterium sp.]